MSGNGTGKVLGQGQLPLAKTTLYTVPAATTAYVRFFSIFNTSGGAESVSIYIKPAATSRKVFGASIPAGNGSYILAGGESFILEAGDLIEGQTSVSATAVDYVICGIEET